MSSMVQSIWKELNKVIDRSYFRAKKKCVFYRVLNVPWLSCACECHLRLKRIFLPSHPNAVKFDGVFSLKKSTWNELILFYVFRVGMAFHGWHCRRLFYLAAISTTSANKLVIPLPKKKNYLHKTVKYNSVVKETAKNCCVVVTKYILIFHRKTIASFKFYFIQHNLIYHLKATPIFSLRK